MYIPHVAVLQLHIAAASLDWCASGALRCYPEHLLDSAGPISVSGLWRVEILATKIPKPPNF